MKRSLLLFWALSLIVPAFGQIQIESSGETKTYSQHNKSITNIVEKEDGYFYYLIPDYKCNQARLEGYNIEVFIGKTKDEVAKSAETLKNWFSNAKNEAFIYVTNPDGTKICLYKYNANLYASHGNEMNCKDLRVEYGLGMTQVLMGMGSTASTANVAANAAKNRQVLLDNLAFGQYTMTGMCGFKSGFLKSIKNFMK